MARKFYTEVDIEDLFKQGVRSLEVSDQVTLTELAYEKAQRLGMVLTQAEEKNPSAPVRPYLSQPVAPAASGGQGKAESRRECGCKNSCQNPAPQMSADLKERIRSAVMNRMGGKVDAELLDKVIERVLGNIGMQN